MPLLTGSVHVHILTRPSRAGFAVSRLELIEPGAETCVYQAKSCSPTDQPVRKFKDGLGINMTMKTFCALFDGSSEVGKTQKRFLLRDSEVLLFFCFYFFPLGDNLFRAPAPATAAISAACRRASISLRSLGLTVAAAFLLSTTPLGGSSPATSTPPALPRWDTSTVLQRKQQPVVQSKTRRKPLFSRVNNSFIFAVLQQ